MTSIQIAQLEFLNETVEFYNINNRCTQTDDPESACRYFREGRAGCAIGRKLEPELSKRLDNLTSSGVGNNSVFNELPESLRELGQEFLVSIQFLHDLEENWNSKGISQYGIYKVKKIKDQFGLIEN